MTAKAILNEDIEASVALPARARKLRKYPAGLAVRASNHSCPCDNWHTMSSVGTPMSDLTHSFILPAYNESERLTTSIPKVLEYIHDRGLHAEIIVVNDGSTDTTAEVVREFAVDNPYDCAAGEPRQSRQGIQRAQRDVARQGRDGFVHRRRSFVAHHRSRQTICGACDRAPMLRSDRGGSNESCKPSASPSIGNCTVGLFNLGLRVGAGARLPRHAMRVQGIQAPGAQIVFTRQRIERWGFDPELLFLARKFRLKTVEVPVEWAHDHRSKINPLRDGLKMGVEVLEHSLERPDGPL